MLKDATGFNHIYLATGYTDMRKGIDGMLMVIKGEFGINPFDTGDIFLFCGRRAHSIKALVFEELSAVFCYPHILYQDPYKTVTSGINRPKICG